MSKIQFHHKRSVSKYVFNLGDITNIKTVLSAKGGTTLALQVPSLEQFNSFNIIDTTEDGWEYRLPTIELDVGLAKCSDEDNYNKKIGRQIATGRMETKVFWARRHTEDTVLLVPCQGKLPSIIVKKEKYPDGNETIRFVGLEK
jgi:hypothetical protein